jgi:hypothetical protein
MNNVKNYVVGQHYRIKDSKWSWKDTKDEGDQYELYKEMYKLSRASLRHFLEDDWEEICFEGEIDHVGLAAKKTCNFIRQMAKSEPCNMLVLGPDCQMVQKTRIFGEFNEFRMFNWTDPKTNSGDNIWGIKLENYFNGDMLYFPHNMKPELWKMYDDMFDSWEVDNSVKNWGNDQIIHNTLFWSQNLTWEDAHRPELFYQAQWIPSWAPIEVQDEWNNCRSTDAHIIHWHASRHIPTKLAAMKNIHEVLNIPEYNGVLI